ncbi:hypothetical protein [Paenibacillus campi]|uniref:hypothetical protein n=1 Tax=Paenibacillus campi TaxID=3106031 RepID=UPI002AFE6AFF|nr:hypothetical protein [Paenibacillus sp. SGZ-1014]
MRLILQEIKSQFSIKSMLGLLVIAIACLVAGSVQSRSYILRDQLDLLGLVMNLILPLVFPVLVLIVYVFQFVGEVRHRALVYTRTRISIVHLLAVKQTANMWTTFIVFACMTLLIFMYVYVVDPLYVHTSFYPERFGINSMNHAQNMYMRHTFTSFLQYGTFAFAGIYCIWVGIFACLYAGIALQLVILLSNSLLAISLPYIFYILASFLCSVIPGLYYFQPFRVIFPLYDVQAPLWTALLTLAVHMFIFIGLRQLIQRRLRRGEVLT